MSKIYIASKSVALGKEHLYLVNDGDGNITTLDDQFVIRGGPEFNNPLAWGYVMIEAGLPLARSEDKLDGAAVTDRHYTEIDLDGKNADVVWAGMQQTAMNMGTLNAVNERYITSVPYSANFIINGEAIVNSNSTVHSVLSSVGINVFNNLPMDVGVRMDISLFTAVTAQFGTLTDGTINAQDRLPNVNMTIVDQGGNTVIKLNPDNEYTIIADDIIATVDIVQINNFPTDGVEYSRDGNDLLIKRFDNQHTIATLKDWYNKLSKINTIEYVNTTGQVLKRVKIAFDDSNQYGWSVQKYAYTPTTTNPNVFQLTSLTVNNDDGTISTKSFLDASSAGNTKDFVLLPAVPNGVALTDINYFAQGLKSVGAMNQQDYELLLIDNKVTAGDTTYFRNALIEISDVHKQLALHLPTGGATYAEGVAFVEGALAWWGGTAPGGAAVYRGLLQGGPTGPYSDGDNVAAIERGYASLIAGLGGLASGYGGTAGQTAVAYVDLTALEGELQKAAVGAQTISSFYNIVTAGGVKPAPGSAGDKFGITFAATITAANDNKRQVVASVVVNAA